MMFDYMYSERALAPAIKNRTSRTQLMILLYLMNFYLHICLICFTRSRNDESRLQSRREVRLGTSQQRAGVTKKATRATAAAEPPQTGETQRPPSPRAKSERVQGSSKQQHKHQEDRGLNLGTTIAHMTRG